MEDNPDKAKRVFAKTQHQKQVKGENRKKRKEMDKLGIEVIGERQQRLKDYPKEKNEDGEIAEVQEGEKKEVGEMEI
jgi:hypothetical protein